MYNFLIDFGVKKAFSIVWLTIFFVISFINISIMFIIGYEMNFGFIVISSLFVSLLFAGFIPVFLMTTKEKLEAQHRIKEILEYDITTGLLNKQFFITSLKREISYAFRYGSQFSLVMLKIANHSDIVFQHGRNTMEHILSQCSSRIKHSLRDSDIIGKYDTYDFVILLPNTEGHGVEVVTERLKKNLEEDAFFFKEKISVKIKIASCDFDKEEDSDSDIFLNRLEKLL